MSFELPPNHFSQADLDASNKSPVYVAVAVGSFLATVGVILRGLARRKSEATFGWDDYTIIFALILLYALDVTTVLPAAKYGLGKHLPAVLSTVVAFQKVSIANITLWLATAAAIKASLLLLYYRLFSPSQRFRSAVRIGAAVVFCQWFSLTLATIFQCRPVAAFWNRSIKDAKCIDLPRFTITSGVLNFLTDVLILCLPIPMVWGLSTTKAQRITLTGIFLLGIFVCAISIIRIRKLVSVNYDDPTWRLVDVFVWTSLENSVGILSACLPTMRPLFGRLSSGGSRVGLPSQKDSRSGTQHTTRAHFNRLFEESRTELTHQGAAQGGADAWTNPDSAANAEVFSMDKITSSSPRSIELHSSNEDQQYPSRTTRRANYE